MLYKKLWLMQVVNPAIGDFLTFQNASHVKIKTTNKFHIITKKRIIYHLSVLKFLNIKTSRLCFCKQNLFSF